MPTNKIDIFTIGSSDYHIIDNTRVTTDPNTDVKPKYYIKEDLNGYYFVNIPWTDTVSSIKVNVTDVINNDELVGYTVSKTFSEILASINNNVFPNIYYNGDIYIWTHINSNSTSIVFTCNTGDYEKTFTISYNGENVNDTITYNVREDATTLDVANLTIPQDELDIHTWQYQLSLKQDKYDIVTNAISNNTITPQVNKYYICGTVNTLVINLPNILTSQVENIILFMTIGSTPAISFNVVNVNNPTIYYSNGFTLETDKTYEVNILWNGSNYIIQSVEYNTGE